MTEPVYADRPIFGHHDAARVLADLLAEVPWTRPRQARAECFMAREPMAYTYGSGVGAETYESVEYHPAVTEIERALNRGMHGAALAHLAEAVAWSRRENEPGAPRLAFNVCFLNRYDDEKNQLGWHADDTPGMLHEHPIAVVSFGAAREIWWRPNGQTGVVPSSQRQLLEPGSLFMMPAGFQRTHQHRIPKCDRPCGPRVSLTFRRYVP